VPPTSDKLNNDEEDNVTPARLPAQAVLSSTRGTDARSISSTAPPTTWSGRNRLKAADPQCNEGCSQSISRLKAVMVCQSLDLLHDVLALMNPEILFILR
jgi:hypothetical protein